MSKAFVLVTLSFLLLTSVIAPSVCLLMDWEVEQAVFNDFAEEEQHKMDKEGFEKDIYLLKLPKFEIGRSNDSKPLNEHYLENSSMLSTDIIIPPPELRS